MFVVFMALTFFILYGSLLALRPDKLAELTAGTILINGQPVRLPVGPVLRLIAGRHRAVRRGPHRARNDGPVADTRALLVRRPSGAADAILDPIFARPVTFYLFTLPAWQLLAGWLTTLAVVDLHRRVLWRWSAAARGAITRRPARRPHCAARGVRELRRRPPHVRAAGLSRAVRAHLRRRTDLRRGPLHHAHVTLTGTAGRGRRAGAGRAHRRRNAFAAPEPWWLVASVVPAVGCYSASRWSAGTSPTSW